MNQSQLEQTNVLINECADQIFKFSPQLFILENETLPIMPKALATSVLYKNNGNFYLITASHVFKDHDYKKIGILSNDTFSYLHGFTLLSQDPENKIDLAIMKLAEHFVEDIQKEYKFLDDSYIIKNLIQYIKENRARTYQEALNLYIEDKKYNNLLNQVYRTQQEARWSNIK